MNKKMLVVMIVASIIVTVNFSIFAGDTKKIDKNELRDVCWSALKGAHPTFDENSRATQILCSEICFNYFKENDIVRFYGMVVANCAVINESKINEDLNDFSDKSAEFNDDTLEFADDTVKEMNKHRKKMLEKISDEESENDDCRDVANCESRPDNDR